MESDLTQGHRAGESKIKARASGQKRLPSPLCWVSSFSRSAAEFWEGGGSGTGPHTALWAVNKELIKISDQNSSSLRTRRKLIRRS